MKKMLIFNFSNYLKVRPKPNILDIKKFLKKMLLLLRRALILSIFVKSKNIFVKLLKI